MNVWVGAVPTPLFALIVKLYVPPADALGVPARVPVPSPLLASVTPAGSAPVSEITACGKPVALTVNVPAVPVVNVVDAALGMTAAWLTTKVNGWTDGLPTPLSAVIVNA